MRLFYTLLITVFLIFVSITYALKSSLLKFNLKDDNYIVLIKKNQTLRGVANDLKLNGVYGKPYIAFILMRVLIGNNKLNAGEYEIVKNDDILSLISKIKNKNYYYRKITFIEGEMISSYINQIKNTYGIIFDGKYEVKEGYFMAGTYLYLYGENANNILKKGNEEIINFVNFEFDKIKNKDDFYLKNINEILTLASIVEKETGIESERELIAGVFYNRLKKNMRLQSDPTTVYEITKGQFVLSRALTYKDLEMKGEYNTYRINGLPISPIASPSKKSILAVLNPAKTDYLFFVADGTGGHAFSVTFAEHKKKVQNYRNILNKKNEAR